MRTKLLAACAALAAGAALAGAGPLDNIGNVTLKGRLGDQLDRMVARHVIGTDRSPAAIRNAAASGRPSRWALN